MIHFKQLWKNHPTITDDDKPCSTNGKPNFVNQCAIRMGVCLERSGVQTKHWPVRRCWFHKNGNGDGGHILAAEELAKSLEMVPFSGLFTIEKFSGKKAFENLSGKSGIVFFRNYYGPGSQGDHIDLWDGFRLTDWRTVFTIHVYGEKYSNSEDVWFWPLY